MTKLLLAVFVVHFIGDFILQTDWMAINKSSKNKALLMHIAVYGSCLLPFGILYALVNATAHLMTDFVTSRITSHLWKRGERHLFFVVIGADQLAHQVVLILTLGVSWFQ